MNLLCAIYVMHYTCYELVRYTCYAHFMHLSCIIRDVSDMLYICYEVVMRFAYDVLVVKLLCCTCFVLCYALHMSRTCHALYMRCTCRHDTKFVQPEARLRRGERVVQPLSREAGPGDLPQPQSRLSRRVEGHQAVHPPPHRRQGQDGPLLGKDGGALLPGSGTDHLRGLVLCSDVRSENFF